MFSVVKNKPPYAIDSVDNALLLAQVLQQEGGIRVTDAAERLDVSPSTAHRLLAMLVYRDFAERSDDRAYVPGRMLRPAPVTEAPLALLRQVALPHLRALTDRLNESSNLMVLVGTEVRFVITVECAQPLRVGDPSGHAAAAISVAMPTARFDRTRLPEWVIELSTTVALIERDFTADQPGDGHTASPR